MTRAILSAATISLMTFGLAGCNNKASSIPTNSSVADVSTPAASSATPAYSAAPSQPVIYDTSTPIGGSSSGSSLAMGNGHYTVKRGDTLYGIARQRYGDGKQWAKIAQANPGLKPETLKVGQSIVVP